jgi:hypothetical protein
VLPGVWLGFRCIRRLRRCPTGRDENEGQSLDVLAHADEGERDTIPVASSVTLRDRQLEWVNHRMQSRIEKLRDSKIE